MIKNLSSFAIVINCHKISAINEKITYHILCIFFSLLRFFYELFNIFKMDQEKAKVTSETTLTFHQLVGKMFRFANDDGPLGIIRLEENGTIGNYSHENEKFWEFDGHCLTVMNHDKSIRCKYVQSWRDYYGKWQMQALWNKEKGHRHYLAEV